MTMPVSQKKVDGGHIKGPANVPSVVEVLCSGALANGKTWRFAVHGFFTTAPPNMQSLASALFTAISGAWGTNLGPRMAAASNFQSVTIRDMTSYLNPQFIGTGTAVPGTGAGNAMPESVAAVLTENIATRGKGMKGRVYLGGWSVDADAGSGQMTAATQTGINAFGTAIFNALTTNNLVPCVAQVARQQYQGITGTVHPQRAAGHVNVTSYTCRDTIWDTQRRRVQA